MASEKKHMTITEEDVRRYQAAIEQALVALQPADGAPIEECVRHNVLVGAAVAVTFGIFEMQEPPQMVEEVVRMSRSFLQHYRASLIRNLQEAGHVVYGPDGAPLPKVEAVDGKA